MPRPKTKEELMLAAKENYEKLQTLISKLSDQELHKRRKRPIGDEIKM